jgi:putative PIN family toxin of toxin-antitoxin system
VTAHRHAGPPRVVFDTNVVLSALLFPTGRLAVLRHIWRDGRAIPLVSRPTTEEFLRVLAYPKFKLSEAERENLIEEFLGFSEVVAIPEPPPRTPTCRDRQDVKFLELAIAGTADGLVTGDADLHALATRFSVPIVLPERWLADLDAR